MARALGHGPMAASSTATQATARGRVTLLHRTLTVVDGGVTHMVGLDDDDAVRACLRERFALDIGNLPLSGPLDEAPSQPASSEPN